MPRPPKPPPPPKKITPPGRRGRAAQVAEIRRLVRVELAERDGKIVGRRVRPKLPPIDLTRRAGAFPIDAVVRRMGAAGLLGEDRMSDHVRLWRWLAGRAAETAIRAAFRELIDRPLSLARASELRQQLLAAVEVLRLLPIDAARVLDAGALGSTDTIDAPIGGFRRWADAIMAADDLAAELEALIDRAAPAPPLPSRASPLIIAFVGRIARAWAIETGTPLRGAWSRLFMDLVESAWVTAGLPDDADGETIEAVRRRAARRIYAGDGSRTAISFTGPKSGVSTE